VYSPERKCSGRMSLGLLFLTVCQFEHVQDPTDLYSPVDHCNCDDYDRYDAGDELALVLIRCVVTHVQSPEVYA
jgi:hypothetical protein